MSRWSQIVASKALGQHFLHDERVLAKIAELALPEPGSGVLEIGPGTGNLTAFLLRHGCPLIAVERDRRLPPLLAERFDGKLDLLRADATRLDYDRLLTQPKLGPAPVVVGNLPYNVGTEILFKVLRAPCRARRIVFMLQREVAQRLIATPSTASYGVLTVKIGIRADVRIALRVRPGAFAPPPRVESSVVVIEPLDELRFAVPSYEHLCKLVDAGFGLRRKTLANALRSRLAVAPQTTRDGLEALGLDVRSRAENLSIENWAALTQHVDANCDALTIAKRSRNKRRG